MLWFIWCFFYGELFFLNVAQLELGLTPFTEDPRCVSCPSLKILGPIKLHALCPFTDDPRTYYFMHAIVGPTIVFMLPFH